MRARARTCPPLSLVSRPASPDDHGVFPHTTDELAAAAGVTANTILIWDRMGLFFGIGTTKTGGPSKGVKRRWAAEAMVRAKKVKELKDRGFGMPAIFQHFELNPPPAPPPRARPAKSAKRGK